ncbi:MAG: hypothetical protein Kow0074_05640 [Candidatus Zixiibacteriota bacterium]
MDDQQDKNPNETNDETRADGSETVDPQVQPVGDVEGTDVPEAVKAAGTGSVVDDPASATETSAPDGEIDASSIADPSMDFPNAAVTDDDGGPEINPTTEAHPAEFPQFGEGTGAKVPRNINLLMDVKLPVSIELGRTTLPIGEILEWGQGSIIELDRLAGEPVDLMVNNKLVAKGEVVVVDEKFGLRITSLMSPRQRLETL